MSGPCFRATARPATPKKNASQLRLGKDVETNFKMMLTDGHFDGENPAGLLARVTSPDKGPHMPPAPMPSWTEAEIATLREFTNDLYAKRKHDGPAMDEMFPAMLVSPYKGKSAEAGSDNTFLTYYQLRGKIKTIFNDDWKRDDKDLFIENLGQFGGADFVRSFNENNKPTATYLAGVDTLAEDVASRAYLMASGPFAGRAASLPSPVTMTVPDTNYRREINRLYQKMLFRDATPTELQAAFGFLKSLYKAQAAIATQSYELRFELDVRDQQGLETKQNFSVKVANDGWSLGQTLVNQNDNTGADDKTHLVRRMLDGPYTFKASDPEQHVIVSNGNTHGEVVVHGIEISGPLPDGTTKFIPVTNSDVQAQGAWKLTHNNGVACYQDENQGKGQSSLVMPVKVDKDGEYAITLLWRKGDGVHNSDNTLVEVLGHGKHHLAVPKAVPLPPRGEARFTFDESDDTISFRDLKTAFKFGPNDGIELSNTGTQKQVVADAVRFTPTPPDGTKLTATGAKKFLVKAKEAEGQDKWQDYKKGEYGFYRPVGPRVVSDDGKEKGKLKLLYKPSAKAEEWKPDALYQVEIGYPGEVRNDTAVPVVVRAQASSPIVNVVYPAHAHVGANILFDATGSYNVQSSQLTYTWRQTGGAYIKLADPHTPKLSFVAPPMGAPEAAWEGLCRALLKHPDFLFTRPLSLAKTQDAATRKHLQLVKIAQDLVGRPPLSAELAKLDKGASISSLVDDYIASKEFSDFYFRRIRLYLESHGTDEDDEPARLWTWIALNDRPFKEILTADYSIDTDWQKQSRPDFYGKSGLLLMKGFIKGKPGLPHFNYPAQVCEKFLGYVFEVPLEVVKIRNGLTAASTTSAGSVCYSCHKLLTPLAYQRTHWTDDGTFKPKDEKGKWLDDSDNKLVASYPFKGNGMEAFAQQAVNKERFIRTMIQTHFVFYYGREMRWDQDERTLYKRLWDNVNANDFNIKKLIRTLVTSPEYLNGSTSLPVPTPTKPKRNHNLVRH